MKDRLLTTDEIKKYHWIYISPASIETTIAILQEQDKKSVAANNAKWRELVDAKDEYIKLLADELESTVLLAYSHGWRSTSYEKGVEIRQKIESILSEMGKEEE